jgi:SAM-dependent methyltransferase
MIPQQKSGSYHRACNNALLQTVPGSACRILEVGCGEGALGEALKRQDPARMVFGLEREPGPAAVALQRLDDVFVLDAEAEDPPLEPASLDCIVYGDVLEHLYDPEAVLRRHRKLLSPDGTILCSIPNIQHHSILTGLLRGDFQYDVSGLLDAGHLRFFTYATAIKMLLDCGFSPSILVLMSEPPDSAWGAAITPLMHHLGLHQGRTLQYLGAAQYVIRGTSRWQADVPGEERPLTFVVCVSNEQTLHDNLLSSPCLRCGSPHQVILARGCRTAAEGLNRGLATATHDKVVCVHQDVYLPEGWPRRFWEQYDAATQSFGRVGVAGVYGAALSTAKRPAHAGHVVDRDRVLKEGATLPARVDTLDELLLVVPRGSGLAFDPALGFHFYGADVCLAARKQGLATVALDALCFHNSISVDLPPAFEVSARRFAQKWSSCLPVATPCVVVEKDGHLSHPHRATPANAG